MQQQLCIEALAVGNIVINIMLRKEYPAFNCSLSIPVEDAALFRIGDKMKVTLESESEAESKFRRL